ncbi:MAG: preprotein translocase subunit SecE [Actinobacteria bacterium]|nr:MAG: preprotein translocase subunit SecE [Actinomycetota bacterium]
MARNRQRAKQRQQRRAAKRSAAGATRHENVPGPLEHASGEVEEFDATLVSGADGETAEALPSTEPEPEPRPKPAEVGLTEVGAPEADERIVEEEPAPPSGGGGRRRPPPPPTGGRGEPDEEGEDEFDEDSSSAEAERALGRPARRQDTPREGNRILAFLRASWAELQRVQWPDRREVAQATAVVLGFVAIAGGYLGLADLVASRIVNAIL